MLPDEGSSRTVGTFFVGHTKHLTVGLFGHLGAKRWCGHWAAQRLHLYIPLDPIGDAASDVH